MLQSIQYIGSGPPTYVFSQNVVGASNAFYHVFAAETSGYDSHRDRKDERTNIVRKEIESEPEDFQELTAQESRSQENLQEVYQKEYGKRELFLWKQR